METQTLQWTCDICNRLRDDADIAVRSYPLRGIHGGTRNLRYCNDSDACVQAALAKAESGTL